MEQVRLGGVRIDEHGAAQCIIAEPPQDRCREAVEQGIARNAARSRPPGPRACTLSGDPRRLRVRLKGWQQGVDCTGAAGCQRKQPFQIPFDSHVEQRCGLFYESAPVAW